MLSNRDNTFVTEKSLVFRFIACVFFSLRNREEISHNCLRISFHMDEKKKVTLSRQGNFIYVDLVTSQEKTLYRPNPQDASGSPNVTPRQI